MQINDLFALTICVYQTIKTIFLKQNTCTLLKKTNRPPTAINMYMSNGLDLE